MISVDSIQNLFTSHKVTEQYQNWTNDQSPYLSPEPQLSITNLAYRTSFHCNSLSFHEKICSCLHNNICPEHNNDTSASAAVDSSEESGSGLSMAVFDKSSLVVMVRGKVS